MEREKIKQGTGNKWETDQKLLDFVALLADILPGLRKMYRMGWYGLD
jgi:hypothetical protein